MPRYKNLYDTLTEKKELLDLFPELRNREVENSWETDREVFTTLIIEQEEALEDFAIDYEDEEDELCQ